MNDLPQALACSMQFRKLIEREMESITETYHLRMMDIIVLYHLDLEERDPDNTGRSMEKELSGKGMCTRSHISQSLSRLLREEYITVERDEKDRRRTHNHLTEKSKPVIRDILEAQHRALDLALDGLTEQELKELTRLLDRAGGNITRALSGSAASDSADPSFTRRTL